MAVENVVAEAAKGAATGDAGGIALGAGLAVLGGAVGTAWAQASVGSSIMGVVAEKPEEAMKLIVYMALPELIVLLGFIAAFMMIQKIPAA